MSGWYGGFSNLFKFSKLRRFHILSGVIFVYLIIYAIFHSHYIHFDYDGYMNLQVPQSLVKDGIYASRYNVPQPFWIHIQTGPSVLVPIAFVFKVFGVSLASAKFVFLLYFTLLLIIVIFIYSYIPVESSRYLFVALLSFLFTPAVFRFALNGYGEFPSLFWLLLSAFLLIRGINKEFSRNILFLSGVSGAMSLLTKLLSFIPVFTMILFLIFVSIIHKCGRDDTRWFVVYWLAGFFFVIFVWEIYKIVSLLRFYHSAYSYFERWMVLLNAMKMEGRGEHLPLLMYFKRAYENFIALSKSLTVNPIFLLCAFAISLYTYIKDVNLKESLSKYIIFILILPHLLWWVFVSPSAWFRRVIVPVMVWKLFVLAPAFMFLISRMYGRDCNIEKRIYYFVGAVITAIVLFSTFTPLKAVFFPTSYSKKYTAQKEMAQFVKNLPESVVILGYGWWQSPAISFLSGRDFRNMEDDANRNVMEKHISYILLGEEQRFLDRDSYRKIKMSTVGKEVKKTQWFYELYENTDMKFHQSQMHFVLSNLNIKEWSSSIDFTEEGKHEKQIGLGVCSYLHGEFRWNRVVEGCLVEDRGVVWLKYNGERLLFLKGYTLQGSKALPLEVEVYLNDKYAGTLTIPTEGEFIREMSISDLSLNLSVIRVLLRSASYLVLKNRRKYSPFWLAKERRLSFVIKEIGLR